MREDGEKQFYHFLSFPYKCGLKDYRRHKYPCVYLPQIQAESWLPPAVLVYIEALPSFAGYIQGWYTAGHRETADQYWEHHIEASDRYWKIRSDSQPAPVQDRGSSVHIPEPVHFPTADQRERFQPGWRYKEDHQGTYAWYCWQRVHDPRRLRSF